MRHVFEEIQSSANIEDLRLTMQSFAQSVGFTAMTYSVSPESKIEGHRWVAFGIPERALAFYRRNRLELIDPIPPLVVRTGEPVVWSSVYSSNEVPEEQARYFRQLTKFGVTDGITFPTYGRHTRLGLVSFGQIEDSSVIENCNLAYLHAVAQHAHFRFDQLENARERGPKLSRREREILFWIMKDKSNTDIAMILSISPTTVATHIKRMFGKLEVNSRIGAIQAAPKAGAIWC